MGVEIAVGAFFNGHEFISRSTSTSSTRSYSGNIGSSTGEMGTSMYWSAPNRIFNQTLAKMEKKLREERYVGYIDLNCIVNGQGSIRSSSRAFRLSDDQNPAGGLNARSGRSWPGSPRGDGRSAAQDRIQIGVRISCRFSIRRPKTSRRTRRSGSSSSRSPTTPAFHRDVSSSTASGWSPKLGSRPDRVRHGPTMRQARRRPTTGSRTS